MEDKKAKILAATIYGFALIAVVIVIFSFVYAAAQQTYRQSLNGEAAFFAWAVSIFIIAAGFLGAGFLKKQA